MTWSSSSHLTTSPLVDGHDHVPRKPREVWEVVVVPWTVLQHDRLVDVHGVDLEPAAMKKKLIGLENDHIPKSMKRSRIIGLPQQRLADLPGHDGQQICLPLLVARERAASQDVLVVDVLELRDAFLYLL